MVNVQWLTDICCERIRRQHLANPCGSTAMRARHEDGTECPVRHIALLFLHGNRNDRIHSIDDGRTTVKPKTCTITQILKLLLRQKPYYQILNTLGLERADFGITQIPGSGTLLIRRDFCRGPPGASQRIEY